MDITQQNNLDIAVVGAGISGICAAQILQQKHRVSLFEKNDYFGGHTHTVVIPEGPDKGTPVDTGFIVLNQKTYPNFIRFLEQTGVEKRRTDMSFGYFSEATGLCYASQGLDTIFAQRANLFRPKYLRFVYEMVKFLKVLRRTYLEGRLADVSLSEYIRQMGLHKEVVEWFIIPMAASIWSGSDFQMGQFPVRTFAQFYENHGLLAISGHPPWYYVKGGSHTYVRAFLKSFQGEAYASSGVVSISRQGGKPVLSFADREPRPFDAVVIAAHADQALKLLADPDDRERELLGAWTYSRNTAVLHTDTSVMPPNPRAWASWNYTRHRNTTADSPVTVTYDMTRLQRLNTRQKYFVTLNPTAPISEPHVVKTMEYTHPQYSFDAFNSQKHLPGLNNNTQTFFCGSYFGYGFHEDGVNSALAVGEKFGVGL
ncbi:MAG: FAD-dependent oxidoreductase [Desulfobacter sp.]